MHIRFIRTCNGVITLPITLRVKCGKSTVFITKNIPKFMPKMCSTPRITIMNKLFWLSEKPNNILKQ